MHSHGMERMSAFLQNARAQMISVRWSTSRQYRLYRNPRVWNFLAVKGQAIAAMFDCEHAQLLLFSIPIFK